ncbi:MAG: rhomboid family intramembrane serine protease, partial [Pseudomonadota bacterium]
GTVRLIALCALGSIAGAGAHYIFNTGSPVPMVGASAIVSACTGAAIRFAFQPGQQLTAGYAFGPLMSLPETFRNQQTFSLIAIWMVLNYISGSSLVDLTGEGHSIAWQAHIGGFVAGIIAFPVFDPYRRDRFDRRGFE